MPERFKKSREPLEVFVGRQLMKRGLTIAVAESCTGGLISHLLTNVPNSSLYFERGLVCYSDRSKVELLGIPSEMIKQHTPVSPQVTIAMAERVRDISNTDAGLSSTGLTGPAGGKRKRPVGLAYVALATASGTELMECRFKGKREEIKNKVAYAALNMISRWAR